MIHTSAPTQLYTHNIAKKNAQTLTHAHSHTCATHTYTHTYTNQGPGVERRWRVMPFHSVCIPSSPVPCSYLRTFAKENTHTHTHTHRYTHTLAGNTRVPCDISSSLSVCLSVCLSVSVYLCLCFNPYPSISISSLARKKTYNNKTYNNTLSKIRREAQNFCSTSNHTDT